MSARPVLAITIAVAVADSLAAAQPRPAAISIEYIAPAQCPDEISLKAGVIARLGHDPFQGEAPRRALIDVQPTAAGFVAAIELQEAGRPPTRKAVGPTLRCEDAVDALELALAVIIDPTAANTPAAAAQAPPPSPPPPAAPVGYEPPGWRESRLAPPAGPPALRRHELGLTIGVVSGMHPESTGYFGVRAGYLLDERFRIGLVGRLSTGSGRIDDERTYETRLSEVAAEGCYRKRFLQTCAELGAGSKSVRIYRYIIGTGGDYTAEYSEIYALVGANAALEVPLGRAFLRPQAEAAIPLPNVPIESEGIRHFELPFALLAFDLTLGFRW